MKIKTLTRHDFNLVEFEGKYVKGQIWNDGSGELTSKLGHYHAESGRHSDRVRAVTRLAKDFNNMLKELKTLDKALKKKRSKLASRH